MNDNKPPSYSENHLSKIILSSSIKIHRSLGPGLLESAYQKCLIYELQKKDLLIEPEKSLAVVYEDIQIQAGYRVDLMINKKVIVELKTVDSLDDIHLAQILTYLKLSDSKLGLLINFNRRYLKDGFRRVVNNLEV